MQVVFFKEMPMRTTRRLKITDSRREVEPFCCLAIVQPEYGGGGGGGVSSCFSVATILWKK